MTRLLPILIACALLAGCATTLTSQRRVEIVNGKPITYIVVKSGGTIFDHSCVMDRYGPDGTLIAHDAVNNNGILETLGGQALTTMVPAASALGLVK